MRQMQANAAKQEEEAEDGLIESSEESGDEGCCQRCHQTRFTNFGDQHGDLSHDGSPHVTDEVFNAASHLMGGMLSILGTTVLVTRAGSHKNPWAIVGFALYGGSLCFLFFASFWHHAIRGSEGLMQLLRKLDYVAIYFLIPGTFTPLCLVCLHNTWVGWVFLGCVWALAMFGVVLQTACTGPLTFPMWASMTMYITLGWFGAFLAIPAFQCIGLGGCLLMLLGGLGYTIGGVFYTLQWPNPVPGRFGFHEIWHIFVLIGAGFHWAMMFFYVCPVI